jgi:hypothetical protein
VEWCLNFSSASGGAFPSHFAKGSAGEDGVNQRMLDFLSDKTATGFGTLMMDYPEYPPPRCSLIDKLASLNPFLTLNGHAVQERAELDQWPNVYFLDTASPITVDGVIDVWRFYARGIASPVKRVQLVIYRPRTGAAGKYDVVGKTGLVEAWRGYNEVSAGALPVKAGDLVGFYQPDGGVIAYDAGQGGQVLYTASGGSETQFINSSARTYSIQVGVAQSRGYSASVGPDGYPYVVNDGGDVWRYRPYEDSSGNWHFGRTAWTRLGGQSAADIGVGPGGDVWIVAPSTAGSAVFEWNEASSQWDKRSGEGTRIAVGPRINGAANVWVISATGEVWQRIGTNWTPISGETAIDIGVATDGTAWIISTRAAPGGGNQICTWTGTRWDSTPGSAIRIAAGAGGWLCVVDDQYDVLRYDGTEWSRMPGAKATDVGLGADNSVWAWGWNAQIAVRSQPLVSGRAYVLFAQNRMFVSTSVDSDGAFFARAKADRDRSVPHALEIVGQPAGGAIVDGDTVFVRTTEAHHHTWCMGIDPADGDRVHYDETKRGAAEQWIVRTLRPGGVVRTGDAFHLESVGAPGTYLVAQGNSAVEHTTEKFRWSADLP